MKQYEIIVEAQETVRYRVLINADSKLEAKNAFNSNKYELIDKGEIIENTANQIDVESVEEVI